ncbi:Leucine-rich repeat-containing protein 59 [Merluccius polli]|uniref:Leucine-rich repeat-containing protein 59 n=1 Tax=Merluccius polli TaxID=89951 RepID=A0AA47M642_MERPO|nr:Leucine-rich repeat-containing protein 59 [Merluccius polli]
MFPVVEEGEPDKPHVGLLVVILGVLREVKRTLETRLETGQDVGGKPGYWTKFAKKIHLLQRRFQSVTWIFIEGFLSVTTTTNSSTRYRQGSLGAKMSKGKVLNLKDKINGNELDLSLCNLSEVPVKELAAFRKATVLDLSCNNITSLPPEFCKLTHLVKVDLSKNQLTCLPDDLGNLGNLQHLDLYNNKLPGLPVSFSQLRNLKWLDLKDNPLEPELAKVAGDCLDEKQCKQCASKVLQHMKDVQEEKKKEAKQREREAKEREVRKREKAEEKERRRKEYQAQMDALAAQEHQRKKKEEKKKRIGQAAEKKAAVESAPKPRRSVIGLLFKLLLLLLLGWAGAVAACQLTDLRKEMACVPVNTALEEGLSWVRRQEVVVRQLVQDWSTMAKELLESTQASKN